MSITTCGTCGGTYHWSWEDAFDKFGFGDGDGMVMTDTVADVLREAGYTVTVEPWGFHNIVIMSVKRDKQDLVPPTAVVGYDNPRHYLPTDIIDLLDEKLSKDAEVHYE